MRDYKVYLPHHNSRSNLGMNGHCPNSIALMGLIIIVVLMAVATVQAIVHSQEIEEASSKAVYEERQRIVAALARDIDEHQRYASYLNGLIAKEYRGR